MLKILPVTYTDKELIFAISAKIWEGYDYIHLAFNDWIDDKASVFASIWENNQIIAFGNMTDLGDGNFWLEGLRKDPDVKIRGVGKALSEYMFEQLKKRRVNSIRFATYFDNLASIKLNEKRGFIKILTLSLKSRQARKISLNLQNLDFKAELDEIVDYIHQSNYLKKCNNFISFGWLVKPFSKTLIKSCFDNGDITVYRKKNKIIGVMIASLTYYENELWISYIDGDSDEVIQALINFADHVAMNKQKKELIILHPENSILKKVTDKDGFSSWEHENDFFLYELPLDKL